MLTLCIYGDEDMLRQMRSLYTRSNKLLQKCMCQGDPIGAGVLVAIMRPPEC